MEHMHEHVYGVIVDDKHTGDSVEVGFKIAFIQVWGKWRHRRLPFSKYHPAAGPAQRARRRLAQLPQNGSQHPSRGLRRRRAWRIISGDGDSRTGGSNEVSLRG
jgi:hypothetical protein